MDQNIGDADYKSSLIINCGNLGLYIFYTGN